MDSIDFDNKFLSIDTVDTIETINRCREVYPDEKVLVLTINNNEMIKITYKSCSVEDVNTVTGFEMQVYDRVVIQHAASVKYEILSYPKRQRRYVIEDLAALLACKVVLTDYKISEDTEKFFKTLAEATAYEKVIIPYKERRLLWHTGKLGFQVLGLRMLGRHLSAKGPSVAYTQSPYYAKKLREFLAKTGKPGGVVHTTLKNIPLQTEVLFIFITPNSIKYDEEVFLKKYLTALQIPMKMAYMGKANNCNTEQMKEIFDEIPTSEYKTSLEELKHEKDKGYEWTFESDTKLADIVKHTCVNIDWYDELVGGKLSDTYPELEKRKKRRVT